MVHLVPGSKMPLLALAVFLSLIPWMEESEGWPQLIGSSEPIRAPLGGDVTLPCVVQPQINMENVTVTWSRPDIPEPNWVLHYENQHQKALTMPSYAGRTEMFADGLKLGNVSVRIRNLQPSDDGRYRCFIPMLGIATTIMLELFDQLIGSSEPIRAPLGGDVTLPCVLQPQINMEGMTVMWSRPDIHVDPNRYVHRHLGPDEAQKMLSYVGRTEMFADGLKLGNLSLRISNLQPSDNGRYRCIIPPLALNTTIKLELFGLVSLGWHWIPVCILVVLAVGVLAVGAVGAVGAFGAVGAVRAVGAVGYCLKPKFQRPHEPECSVQEPKPPPSKYSRASFDDSAIGIDSDSDSDIGTGTDTDPF